LLVTVSVRATAADVYDRELFDAMRIEFIDEIVPISAWPPPLTTRLKPSVNKGNVVFVARIPPLSIINWGGGVGLVKLFEVAK
jgi:hypothetical protein